MLAQIRLFVFALETLVENLTLRMMNVTDFARGSQTFNGLQKRKSTFLDKRETLNSILHVQTHYTD